MRGILFELLNSYPEPLVIILKDELDDIGAPLPSIIPVTLTSSASPAAPVLTFLPIGRFAWLAPALVSFTICFLGNVCIGF